MAVPLEIARDDVLVVPSTTMVRVPVGVVVLELAPDATVIEIVSSAPDSGELVAAVSVVMDGSKNEAGIVGHTWSKLKKSRDPSPEASS